MAALPSVIHIPYKDPGRFQRTSCPFCRVCLSDSLSVPGLSKSDLSLSLSPPMSGWSLYTQLTVLCAPGPLNQVKLAYAIPGAETSPDVLTAYGFVLITPQQF